MDTMLYFALAAYFLDMDADTDLKHIRVLADKATSLGFSSDNYNGNVFAHDEDGRILTIELGDVTIRTGKKTVRMSAQAFLALN